MDDEPNKPEKKQKTSNTLCGLTWASSGSPFFYCLVGEKREVKEKGFDEPEAIIEVTMEGEYRTFKELTDAFEWFPGFHCREVYTVLEPRYLTFIRSFNDWKRKEKAKLALKQTKSSSFEASLLRVKELIGEKRLIFPEESAVKSQLTVFSKANLKDNDNFYAVKALTMVIDSFTRKTTVNEEEKPTSRGWW